MKIVAFVLCLLAVSSLSAVLFIAYAVAVGEIEVEKWREKNGDERE